MKGLILEGISGSGKSTLIDVILKSEHYNQKKPYSEIFLSEVHTQRLLEKKEHQGDLQKSDNISLLDFHLNYLEKICTYMYDNKIHDLIPIRPKMSVLLERFHLTHYCQYPNLLNWDDLAHIDDKLAEMEFKLCVLLIDKHAILDRLIKGRAENQAWMDYVHTFGKKNSAIINHFLEQQERLMCSLSHTALCYMSINTSIFHPEEVAEKVIDFWFA